MRQLDALQTLQRSKKSLFKTADLKKLFDVEEDNTLYKQIERLTAAGVLRPFGAGTKGDTSSQGRTGAASLEESVTTNAQLTIDCCPLTREIVSCA
jgi:hypothetical protein